jgi:hypothetical protein
MPTLCVAHGACASHTVRMQHPGYRNNSVPPNYQLQVCLQEHAGRAYAMQAVHVRSLSERPAAYKTVHCFSSVPAGCRYPCAWLFCISNLLYHAGLGVPVTPNVSTGNGLDFLAGRVSYTFGLTGGAQRLPWPGTATWVESVRGKSSLLSKIGMRGILSKIWPSGHALGMQRAPMVGLAWHFPALLQAAEWPASRAPPSCCSSRAGPCLATHTACSSSLVAAHLAAAALERREAPAAAAAGVFLILLAGTMAGICQLQVGL